MTMRSPVRIIEARTGEIRWNWNYVENAHISHLYDRGEVDLRMLSKRKAAEVVEYMAAHESINKAANACITLTDEEIELLTNYAELNGDEASYLRVLCFMLKEGLYDNCVLWLPMTRNLRAGINDTDTEVYDRSPFGNHGTIYGAVWQTLPSGKSALSFDGVDDYVNAGNDSSLHFGANQSFTLSVWFMRQGPGEIRPRIIAKRGSSGDKERTWYEIYLYNEDQITFEVRNLGSFQRVMTSWSVSNNKWYHVVGVRDIDAGKEYLYVNGKLEGSTNAITAYADVESDPLTIGTYLGVSHFNGTIDEVRIYSRALSEEEIRRLFNLTRVFYGV